MKTVKFEDDDGPCRVVKWKVKPSYTVYRNMQVLHYRDETNEKAALKKWKAKEVGTIVELLAQEGEVVKPGDDLFTFEPCKHPTVMKEMCAECGADLQSTGEIKTMSAAIPIVHSIPELMVSPEEAQTLGLAEEERLLRDRKLVLLVDLDQTLIHTTNDVIPPKVKDVFHYKLGANPVWYHTRLRPHAREFLAEISAKFELHICTFGARQYAHQIAFLLDPDSRYFSSRILSRDECFDPRLKTANLKALFPCGDHMVCIIDDREDVWNWAPNLVRVKPYHFFKHTGDINAPPGMTKAEDDDRFSGVDLEDKKKEEKKELKTSKKPEEEDEVEDDKETDKSEGDSSDDEQSSSAKEVEEKTSKEKEKSVEKMEENGNKETPKEEEKEKPEEETPKEEEQPKEEKEKPIESKEQNGKKEEGSELNPEDPDDHLLHLTDILKRIHEKFFLAFDSWKSRRDFQQPKKEEPLPDLKRLIPEIRASVLSGVNIVFSGVVPTRTPLKQSAPFRIATALGANVTENLVDEGPSKTTHLVASRYGTAKVHQVKKKPGISLVTPEWLWSCTERWEHVDERLFRLSKEHSSASSSSNKPLGLDYDTPPPPNHRKNNRNSEEEEDVFETEERREAKKFEGALANPCVMWSREELDDLNKEVDDECSSESSLDEEDNGEEEKQEDKTKDRQKRRQRLSRSIDVDEGEIDEAATAMEEEGTCSESENDEENEELKRRIKRRKLLATTTTTDDSDVNAALYPKEGLVGSSDDDEDFGGEDDDTLDGLAHQLEDQMDHY